MSRISRPCTCQVLRGDRTCTFFFSFPFFYLPYYFYNTCQVLRGDRTYTFFFFIPFFYLPYCLYNTCQVLRGDLLLWQTRSALYLQLRRQR
jgi:hypothetical protein